MNSDTQTSLPLAQDSNYLRAALFRICHQSEEKGQGKGNSKSVELQCGGSSHDLESQASPGFLEMRMRREESSHLIVLFGVARPVLVKTSKVTFPGTLLAF